jgi:hypothetical protein
MATQSPKLRPLENADEFVINGCKPFQYCESSEMFAQAHAILGFFTTVACEFGGIDKIAPNYDLCLGTLNAAEMLLVAGIHMLENEERNDHATEAAR